jgi:hypothetical protein
MATNPKFLFRAAKALSSGRFSQDERAVRAARIGHGSTAACSHVLFARKRKTLVRAAGSPTLVGVQELLLAWFHANGRDLPWRETSDPYAILVSEVMAQQ